ncbi:MAG: aminopeptidase [Anaerovoracaceae bacterium]|jgi:aminopeptidase
MDPRIEKLSSLLVQYSCRVQPGERVMIDVEGRAAYALARQLVRDVYAAGGLPYVSLREETLTREVLLGCSEDQIAFENAMELARMEGMQAYIAVRGSENSAELADVPAERLNLYNRVMQPVLDQRVNHTKWVILRYPNGAMAQRAGTSQEAFADFFFDVCTLDYAKMSRAMDPLAALMEKTDRVRIKGPGTDLTFSIRGIPAVKCCGECNIPDGEVYTAPVKESMNGFITYNTPSEEQGFTYEKIAFEIRDGKITSAAANDEDRIRQLLDTDEGSRYFGEFSLGVNPYILSPMKDTLFDEKICGSFHLTPGCCYEDAPNGNYSALHWDLVCIQRADYGGGEIWFDDRLIRKDGLFVIPELEGLNPERLK